MEIISRNLKRHNQLLLLLMLILTFIILSPFVTIIHYFIQDQVYSQSQLNIFNNISLPELRWALQNTFLQAIISSFFIVLISLWGAFGLFYLESNLKPKVYRFIEILLLAPILLPSLYLVLACFIIIKPFPFGILGISIVHVIHHTGTGIIGFKTLIENKIGNNSELALIEGANKYYYIWNGIIKGIKKEITYIFIYFFTICFTSFQIPLLTGGSQGTTLEVLISEKILIDNNLKQALGLALVQFLFLIILNYVSHNTPQLNQQIRNYKKDFKNTTLLNLKFGVFFIFLLPIFTLITPLLAIPKGVLQLHAIHFNFDKLLTLSFGSLKIGLISGAVMSSLLICICLLFDFKFFERFIRSYVSPSPVVMGTVLFLWKWLEFVPSSISLSVGLSILWVGGVYRIYLHPLIENLNLQIAVAKVMGANSFLIFKTIILPQISIPLFYAVGTSTLWTVGDFAISQFITGQPFHLSMTIKSLASGYRLEAGLALSWILLFVGGICFYFFTRIGNVISKKSFL